ncbi:hypothetical protein PHYBOEH_000077 [Phytophthora boehmeriae]|uniref:FMR1-interacting protein 1 conserved domain-containing protein n=1 Tax=Phytophthora boehmeriae TaxID=109152 RepID=A0A8T1XFD4_9STRA|nr:hypothetical protein PHYBOEH_000077 [Phytophthora boehmeriae]
MRTNVRLLRLALRQVGPASATLQQRGFHASVVAPARRNRRSPPRASASPEQQVFEGSTLNEADDEEIAKWFEEMQKQFPSKARNEDKEEEQLPHTMEMEDDEDEDSADEDDEDADQFLDEAEELFRLSPTEFQNRMKTFDQRHAHEADDDDDDRPEIDRATERIPKKKLLKVMGELNSNKPVDGKSAERMPKTKNMAPLEKKPKQPKSERISYRQESVGIAVMEYVQNLLYEDADVSGTDIVPQFVEATVSPDLRRIILFWIPMRLGSQNQTVGKRKVESLKNRLTRQERWVRRSVTQHLNLKYSPVIQFKQQKEAKAEEARTLFDDEMKWLDKV